MTTTAQRYAISHWPDTDELIAKGHRLVSAPPRPIRRDKMQDYLAYFETRCAGSKASTAEAAKSIPGGVQHNLAFNYPFPLNIARAGGAYLWDVDGNRYVDFLQAGGPTVLGSNYAPVREQVIKVLNACGPVTGLFHEYEYKLAVVAGAIDNSAAAVGSGAVRDYQTHLYIGTSSWLAAHVPFKKTDIVSALASVPCAIPGRYLLTALQATAGGNLTFLRDKILYHKDELLQEEEVPDVYQLMDRIAARTPAGSNGVLYTPWIYGERAPVEDSSVRAAIFNLSLENSRADGEISERHAWPFSALGEEPDRPPAVDQNLDEKQAGTNLDGGHARRRDVRQRLANASVQNPHCQRIGHLEPAGEARAEGDRREQRQGLIAVVARAGEPAPDGIEVGAIRGKGVCRLPPRHHEPDPVKAEPEAEQRKPASEADQRSGGCSHASLLASWRPAPLRARTFAAYIFRRPGANGSSR
ncbi:MAG TPA: FGGY-family carbohydrate kinase [Candidatus Binatia bacterium]